MFRRWLIIIASSALLAACGYGDHKGGDSTEGGPASIEIMSPADGAQVNANQPFELQYKVHKSPRGNHIHIIVDMGGPTIVRQMEGSYEVGPLKAGPHTITIVEVTSNHAPTGIQKAVHVTAE